MSARSPASRRPMLRPWAPIGGTTWAASPTRAMRLLAICAGRSIASGNLCRPGSTVVRPEDGVRLLLDGLRQFLIAQRHQPLALARRGDPDDTAAIAGQGNERARASGVWNSVEIFLCGLEWAMLKVSAAWPRSRRLTSMPAASRHIDCRPSAPATSLASSDLPARVTIATEPSSGVIVCASSSSRARPESSAGTRLQCGNQRAVVDIVAELLQSDFLGHEAHLGRPDQAAGIVDEPHHPERRGAAWQRRQTSEVDRADPRWRQAAPWCGCPHRARGGRAGRSSPRHRQAQSPP